MVPMTTITRPYLTTRLQAGVEAAINTRWLLARDIPFRVALSGFSAYGQTVRIDPSDA
jgi:hypothetical protein